MAFIQDTANSSPRAYSIGPTKQAYVLGTVAAADTTCSITCAPLAEVRFSFLTGVQQAAVATYVGNTATYTFNAPGATTYIIATFHGV